MVFVLKEFNNKCVYFTKLNSNFRLVHNKMYIDKLSETVSQKNR